MAAALAPSFWIEVVLLAPVGATSVTFLTTGNSTAQLAAAPEFRGRVTALWSTALVGSTPIGAPIIGVLADTTGPRSSLAVGALACAAAVLVGVAVLHRSRSASPPASSSREHEAADGLESRRALDAA